MPAQRPTNATEYIFYAAFESTANAPDKQLNPTIAVGGGDFTLYQDGVIMSPSVFDTIPVAVGASSYLVKFVVSVDEMTCDNLQIECVDAAGDEWNDLIISIQPQEALISVANDFPTNFSDMTIEVTTGIVDGNVQKINDATVTGDGNATPWDGA